MSIYKNNKKVGRIYKGSTQIYKVYKGTSLVYKYITPQPTMNILYSMPWYNMNDLTNGNSSSYTELISKDNVDFSVYQYSTSSKCQDSYCISNLDASKDTSASFPIKIGTDLTNAKSIIMSMRFEGDFDYICNEYATINFLTLEDIEQHTVNWSYLQHGGNEYPKFLYGGGSAINLPSDFYNENLKKTNYFVININGENDGIYLYDSNGVKLAELKVELKFDNVHNMENQGMAMPCPSMNTVHIRHMSIIDKQITDGTQLKQLDELVDSYKPSSPKNHIKGKYNSPSTTFNVKINNSNYPITVDSSGNFDTEYNGDAITSVQGFMNRLSGVTECELSIDTSNVDNMYQMFNGCRNLTSLDVTSLNTSNVDNMHQMFNGCRSLTSLDLSNFDTSQVTDISYMFYSCSGLTELNVSNFNTSQVTNMSYMFNGCSSLTTLDLSGWNTSQVTTMYNIFSNCSGLTSLDVSGFDISQVTNMGFIFYNCRSLTSLDLSSWDTSNVTSMRSMFYNCSKLTSLDLSSWDTSKVTSMYNLFYFCSGLSSINLSNWNTSQVTNMEGMFTNCSNLESLDLSSFDMSQVTSMSFMFFGSNNLSNITCTQATKDKLMTLSDSDFPTKDTVQWNIV